MQDQEIIRFKLKDYFGESFAFFDHEMYDTVNCEKIWTFS